MNLKDIKGFKYPRSRACEVFFKQDLHTKGGRVLEYGCSNANNLSPLSAMTMSAWAWIQII